jgi:hypothetical protein
MIAFRSKRAAHLLCALTFFLTGCASPTDIADNESELTTWTKVTSCDSGAMVVDVKGYPMTPAQGHDPDYAVQAVVRDERIVQYLASRGAVARNEANRREAIVPGHIWLSTFHTPRFDGAFNSELPNGVTARLTRYGSGIKLVFEREAPDHLCPSFCVDPSDPEYNPGSGVCEGCAHSARREEIANWWFASCPVLADVHR